MPVPTSLALTSIADGSQAVAATVRNNYTDIQTAVNDLIAFFGGGIVGSTLVYDGTDWAPTANITIDDTNSAILGTTVNLGHATVGPQARAAGFLLLQQTNGSGYFQLPEQSVAPVGTNNTARLYAIDNGAGKTQLMVIFGSGVAQQLAIEP